MMTGFLPFFRFTVYTLLRFIIIIVIKWACRAADHAPTDDSTSYRPAMSHRSASWASSTTTASRLATARMMSRHAHSPSASTCRDRQPRPTTGIKEGDNPHVWFSAKVRNNTADAITAAYQKADPSHKDDYAKLNKEWHAKEDQLESKIKDASAKTKDVPYAATESVAWYLADDLGMKDATPTGYAQASANESEPTPSDIKAFQDALKGGSIKMLVFNTQEANSTTDQITGAAKSANVSIVELTEQMPKEYTNLLDWMSALVDQFAKA